MGTNSNEKYVFISFSAYYSDEFNVYGYLCCSESEWNNIEARVRNFFDKRGNKEIERFFGTNEALTFYSYEDWGNYVTTTDVPKSFFKTWEKLPYEKQAHLGVFCWKTWTNFFKDKRTLP